MVSCANPINVLIKTIANTTAASTHSDAMREITQAPTRMSTNGLLNWLSSNPHMDGPVWRVRELGPTSVRRRRASVWVSPCGVVCRSKTNACVGTLQKRSSSG